MDHEEIYEYKIFENLWINIPKNVLIWFMANKREEGVCVIASTHKYQSTHTPMLCHFEHWLETLWTVVTLLLREFEEKLNTIFTYLFISHYFGVTASSDI